MIGLINYNHNELCKWEVNSVKAEQSFFMSFKMNFALRGSGQTLYGLHSSILPLLLHLPRQSDIHCIITLLYWL